MISAAASTSLSFRMAEQARQWAAGWANLVASSGSFAWAGAATCCRRPEGSSSSGQAPQLQTRSGAISIAKTAPGSVGRFEFELVSDNGINRWWPLRWSLRRRVLAQSLLAGDTFEPAEASSGDVNELQPPRPRPRPPVARPSSHLLLPAGRRNALPDRSHKLTSADELDGWLGDHRKLTSAKLLTLEHLLDPPPALAANLLRLAACPATNLLLLLVIMSPARLSAGWRGVKVARAFLRATCCWPARRRPLAGAMLPPTRP